MMKVIISEKSKYELDSLSFDIERAISKIISYVPKIDLIGIDHIYITDSPEKWKKCHDTARGAYYASEKNQPAYIELYLKNMFRHVKNPKSFKDYMLPYQYVGIAYTIFHEIGHHIETVRTHGIKKKRQEQFSNTYMNNLINKYLLDNADSINSCLDYLDQQAEKENLSKEILKKMREGWEKQYQEAVSKLSWNR
jgi:hypothetical protein